MRILLVSVLLATGASVTSAQSVASTAPAAPATPAVPVEPAPVTLPEFAVVSRLVANQEPGAVLAMPVSGLRFEPRVDVQGRNLAEAQADVALRGGIFENTGFKLGGLALFDPQTGHYLAELPVAPAMLEPPAILTGADNALAGLNAGVGTVAYAWRPIETRGELALAAGNYEAHRESLYQGLVAPLPRAGWSLGADVAAARSESEGSVPFGDHEFWRVGGRVQLRGPRTQTDAFAGYQEKFFGWPNLYTPFGFNETENLQTVLLGLNHRWADPAGNVLQASAFYRRNKDDYEFDRARPGASNPFQHTTWLRGGAVEGRRQFASWALNYAARFSWDDLKSTALTFGRFRSRTYTQAALVPEFALGSADHPIEVRAGAVWADTDHDSGALSPQVALAWGDPAAGRFHLEYAETTQVPTYTALNSNAAAGLFRGNANLGRTTSRNLEFGAAFPLAGWTIEATAFQRWDDALVDWTFRRGVTARTANAVDVGTFGTEFVASRRTPRHDLVLGYTFLAKSHDFGGALVDASFYALNFAKHRLTAALTWRLGAGFEVRSDNELRVQADNLLRTTGGDEALLSSLGLFYLPPRWRGWEFSLLTDNLWNSRFQEVPAVPAGRRTVTVGVTRRW